VLGRPVDVVSAGGLKTRGRAILAGVGRPVSRRDDERVADIVDAAREIGEIIGLGREASNKDRIRRR
jgi:hypothetical protein